MIGCAPDTYCQSGPQHGTQCYSGMTVRQQDPLAPVAPMPPPTAHGVSRWISGKPSAQDAAAPEMFGHPRALDGGTDTADDAGDAAARD